MKSTIPSLRILACIMAINTNAHEQPINQFHEILIERIQGIEKLFNELSPHERVTAYYLYRASLPCNRILTDQYHRHGLKMTELFEKLYENRDLLEKKIGPALIKDIKTYLVYLWTNHGQYFKRENENNKRTPDKMKLSLTPELLEQAIKEIGIPNAKSLVEEIRESLFDGSYEPTLTTAGSIEKSAVNMYERGFTKADYDALPADDRGGVNTYYGIDPESKKPIIERYSAIGKYSDELSVSLHWLKKAHHYAAQYPAHFDQFFVDSLESLIKFIKTGNEEFFKEHSRLWLKSSSPLDYTWGFIETYDDPLETTGSIEAEVTIKNYKLEKLSAILPSLEEKLPVPDEYKREKMTSLPNASINTQLFGAGDLGPLRLVAAYCLPNYSEIRSEVGSKQIMYPADRPLAEKINPKLAKHLLYLSEKRAWYEKNDPTFTLELDMENLLTILHETIGHASGRLAQHVFVEGEPVTLNTITYAVGDSVELTSSTLSELLSGYEGSLEELRAEIIALYIAINHLDELAANGFLTAWVSTIEKEDLIEQLILVMAESGLYRLLSQQEDANHITGAHAQANTCIMNYLIDKGGVELVIENITIDGNAYSVPGLRVADLKKACATVTELMQKVQRVKSTGNRREVHELIDTYAKPIRKDVLKIVKANQKAMVGDLKAVAHLYPIMTPIRQDGHITDISFTWPQDFFDANMKFSKLALSTELDDVHTGPKVEL